MAQSDSPSGKAAKCFQCSRATLPDFIVQDGVVPRRRLGEALRRIGEMTKDAQLRCANVFHAGDGNLHPLILYNGRNPGELERAEALAGRILKMCVELGGSITGEHGVGVEKRDYLPEMFNPEEMACLHRIRDAFDPLGLANPGKCFRTVKRRRSSTMVCTRWKKPASSHANEHASDAYLRCGIRRGDPRSSGGAGDRRAN